MVIIEAMANLLGIIMGLCEMLKELVSVSATRNRKRQLINLLYRTAGKENERRNVADFYSYVNHRLNTVSWDSSQVADYSIKMLKNDLKPNASQSQMVFILGDPGSGKSTLMLHLAFWYCSYNNLGKKSSPNDNLSHWGIRYCRMRDYRSLEELKSSLNDNLEALFLDGFDEFIVLQDKSEEEVLEELLSLLLENKSNVFRKIYISSRKEPFKTSLKKALEERNLNGHQPQIIEICPFERKQILAFYRKKSKGKNRYKVQKYLSKHETIFRIPLLIEYADAIMKEYPGKETPSLFQALYAIVKDWIEREEELWHSRQGIGKKWDREKKSAYEKNAWTFILAMCRNMVRDGSYSFSSYEMEKAFVDFDENSQSQQRKFFFSTRQLIHKINEEKYEFIHSLFYEFFVARLLVSLNDVPFEKRKSLLADDNRNYENFYAHWLKELPAEAFDADMTGDSLLKKIEKSIERYVSYAKEECSVDTVEQLRDLISAESVSLRDESELTVYGILWLFPFVGEIKWKSYLLSATEIIGLMEEGGYLALTDGRLKEVSDLRSFFPFHNLDIRNNHLTDLEQMRDYDALDSLCLFGNRIESLEPLMDINIAELEVSIWDEKGLDELFRLPECRCFIDMQEAFSLYIKLEKLQASKAYWRLAFVPAISSFQRFYDKTQFNEHTGNILEAAYHLTLKSFCTDKQFETAVFEFGKEVGKYFYVGKKYKKALDVFEQLRAAAERAGDVDEGILKRIDGWRGQILAKTGEYGNAVPLLQYACGERWEDSADSEMQIMWYWLIVSIYRKEGKVDMKDYGIENALKEMFLWGKELYNSSHFEDAEGVFYELYQKQREEIRERYASILDTQLWLGMNLYNEKKYEEAEKMLYECYEGRKKILGEKHADTLSAQLDLGKILYEEKKYEEAEKIFYKCYEGRKEVLGNKHKDTLDTQFWFGMTFYREQKYEEAEKMLYKCCEGRKEVLGERNEDTLRTLWWLGSNLYETKKYREAEKMLYECFESEKEVFGEKHGDTLGVQMGLGMTLYEEKKYEEAEKMFYECYKGRKETLGEKHVDTLSTQWWLGLTLYEEKKYGEAEMMLYECYKGRKETLGEKHVDTLSTQLQLGLTLNNEGRFEEAERVLYECYEGRKEILGEKHLDTLYVQLWLGANLYTEQKYEEAEKMLQECYEGRKEVLGEGHENTLNAKWWLDLILEKKEK